MKNQKGQATILVAIIFQFVFIFFAMVINVGLLINDKINLQNSVDIAAYYGAMKQAEVLNSMAHVNYEIRQIWKLFAWRLWALADIGRNPIFLQDGVVNFPGYVNGMSSRENEMTYAGNQSKYPVVCVRNPFWSEEYRGTTSQNLCKSTFFNIPPLRHLQLSGLQLLPIFAPLLLFQAQSFRNVQNFNSDCLAGANHNMYFASLLLSAYKTSVINRRIAMRKLEKLLVSGSGTDFRDISGNSVAATVSNVFNKNLTLANRESSPQNFEFYNSVGNQPFLVPIDLHVRMAYVDIWGQGGQCSGDTKEIYGGQTPNNYRSDPQLKEYFDNAVNFLSGDSINQEVTADAFLNAETDRSSQDQKLSLVGFEKNPWVSAYVRVRATTTPKMLFSPVGGSKITLSAEAYAMPFGGRIGPWYGTTWRPSTPASDPNLKTDSLLPPRVNSVVDGAALPMDSFQPNYSRYPGDPLGMKSMAAKVQGLVGIVPQSPGIAHLTGATNYGSVAAQVSQVAPGQPMAVDPVVDPGAGVTPGTLRAAEITAVAPDLFDAVYYSINNSFGNYMQQYSPGFFFSQLCRVGCEDLGNPVPTNPNSNYFTVGGTDQPNPANNTQLWFGSKSGSNWKITTPNDLRTSWAQSNVDDYDTSASTSPITKAAASGGRSGYSVKIVSEQFLRSSIQDLGGKGVSGKISNRP